MIGYRILFVLGALAALAYLALVGLGMFDGIGPWEVLILAGAAGVLYGSHALARRGRTALACLLLLVLVLPGLLAVAAAAYISAVGFGPHH
ncbi:hypothetical protein [Roseomonas indoligenes]|uniref:Uncharacterized protein n=1 Tax=Roseomonas indoligenes TaxID=2820811 RepID=A0A940MYY0_9PROT|nr:hypothetical protein [Pararoseomonas indoligenes]MBP0494721.1 hypothetical protein [Pararoseomonas indoligenes]